MSSSSTENRAAVKAKQLKDAGAKPGLNYLHCAVLDAITADEGVRDSVLISRARRSELINARALLNNAKRSGNTKWEKEIREAYGVPS